MLWGALGTALLALVLLAALLIPHAFRSESGPESMVEATSDPVQEETPSASEPAPKHKRNAPGPKHHPAPPPVPTAPDEPGPKAVRIAISGRDEAPGERNVIKARFAFRNAGRETIRAFRMTWDLPGSPSRKPQVDAYYAPGCRASIGPSPAGLKLDVACSGLDLRAGQTHPGADGISLGIHYQDWSPWGDKAAAGLGPGFAPVNGARIHVED